MPPHFGTNSGKPEIRGWSQGFLSLLECRFSLSVDEVQVAADWAFESGGSMDDSGKYNPEHGDRRTVAEISD